MIAAAVIFGNLAGTSKVVSIANSLLVVVVCYCIHFTQFIMKLELGTRYIILPTLFYSCHLACCTESRVDVATNLYHGPAQSLLENR